MDALSQLLDAQVQLLKSASHFAQSCFNIKGQFDDASSDPPVLEVLVSFIRMNLETHKEIENIFISSQTILQELANNSPRVVPIRRLPPEILSRVFGYAVQGYCGYNYYEELDPLVSITSVCSEWRNIAMHTSSLWCHVDLSPGPQTYKFGYNIELAKLWLERSRERPLHIHFGSAAYGYWGRPDGTEHITQALSPYLHQISSLAFPSASAEGLVAEVFNLFNEDTVSVHHLYSLFIDRIQFREIPVNPSRLSWPVRSLGGLVFLQLNSVGEAQWAPTTDQIFHILSSSPGLRILELRSMTIRGDAGTAASMMHLPELQVLNLKDVDATGLIQLLPKMLCTRPNLHFEVNYYDNEAVAAVTTAFMSRTQIGALGFWFGRVQNIPSLKDYFSSIKSLKILVLGLGRNGIEPILDGLLLFTANKALPRFPELSKLLFIEADLSSQTVADVQQLVEINSINAIDFVDPEYDDEDESFIDAVMEQLPQFSGYTHYDLETMEDGWNEFIQEQLEQS